MLQYPIYTYKVVQEHSTFSKPTLLVISVILSTCCTWQPAKKAWTYFPQHFRASICGEKNPFNVFSDEIWTGELNYSPVCAAPSDDNIVPSRPETLNTKRYFRRVGSCQRSTPLSCLCMHKEHQRLVSDPQMDDLNVTQARPQRQSGKETLRKVRGGSFLCCHPQLLSPPFPLFVCLSIVALSLWFSYLTLLLSHSFILTPPPLVSHSSSLSSLFSHTHILSLFPPFLVHDFHLWKRGQFWCRS